MAGPFFSKAQVFIIGIFYQKLKYDYHVILCYAMVLLSLQDYRTSKTNCTRNLHKMKCNTMAPA